MTKTKKLKYTLIDGIKRNKENPDTFYVPSSKDKNSLRIGDIVKLGFSTPRGNGERMWVLITDKNGDSFKGTLSNHPVFMKLSYGDEVSFESKHIIDLIFEEDK